MKIHNVLQGSPEWLRLRAGKPTGSCADKIITSGGAKSSNAKPSGQAEKYLRDLLTEICIGRPLDDKPKSASMVNGSNREPEAVAYYEFDRNVETQLVGFVTDDAERYGVSPDRLVGDDGLLEVKCPDPQTHLGYAYFGDLDASYRPQIQMQLYVTERKWVDILSYCPLFTDESQAFVMRAERDEEYIKLLAALLDTFCVQLEKHRIMLQDRGFVPAAPAPTQYQEFISDADIEAVIAGQRLGDS